MRVKGFIDLGDRLYLGVDSNFNFRLANLFLIISVILPDGRAIHTNNLSQIYLASSASGILIRYPGAYESNKLGPVSKIKLYFDMALGVQNNSIYSRVISNEK